jgi:hypothetical protein
MHLSELREPFCMNADLTNQSLMLQQKLLERLNELGYADGNRSLNISRHLADAAVRGQAFAQTSLPLFLDVNLEHRAAMAQIVLSLCTELDQLSDALIDVRSDLRDLLEFVMPTE